MRLFHYTVGLWLVKIVRDRQIKCEDEKYLQPGVKPVVWFTTKPTWEETANKSVEYSSGARVDLNREQTGIEGRGLFRIEVDPAVAPYRWRDYKEMSGSNERIIRGLYRVAKRRWSRPEVEWRFALEPVKDEHWLSIEKWNGKNWEVCAENE